MRRADWPLASVVALTLVWTGCGRPSETERPLATPATPVAGSSATKAVSALPAKSTESLEILSVLSVEREVDVLGQRDGILVEILHDQGAHVEQGTVLARLDDRDLLAQMDRARADLQATEYGVKYNEAELKANQAAYRRALEMHKLGLNSDAQLEEAEFKARGSQYDLESWRAAVERSRADIRKLEIDLEKTRIRAPFSGVVARRYIHPGQNVVKDEKCFRLSQLAPLQVRFLVPETAARKPRLGEVVNVVPVSDSQRVYAAKIQKLSPVVDPASGSVEVTAQLRGTDVRALRPGMAVRVLWTTTSPPTR